MLRTVIPMVVVASALALFGGAGQAAATHGDRGGRIAFVYRVAGGPGNVVTIGADGGDFRQLTDTAAGGFNGDPAWTRDGRRLLFTSDRTDGFPHLFTMDANGHDVRQLTSGTTFQSSPTMSPDGRLIA